MAQQEMFPGKVNSPVTELGSSITDTQTTIPVNDTSVFPSAPNLAVIGTDEDAETVKYEGIDGTNNELTSVTRGFQGTAKSWDAGEKIARMFTAYDWDSIRQNFITHKADYTNYQRKLRMGAM